MGYPKPGNEWKIYKGCKWCRKGTMQTKISTYSTRCDKCKATLAY